MKFLLGVKIGMTQIFTEDGKAAPVTIIEAGPVVVTQLKAREKDGYEAMQVGFGDKSRKKLTKSLAGHFKELGNFRWVREYKIKNQSASRGTKVKDDASNEKLFEVGAKIDVSVFNVGDKVTIRGVSKGKGFQGVVKRHGFSGLPKTHGTKKKHRSAGSIGSRFPQHVRKGKRMAGRMGQDSVTIKKVEIIQINKENNLIAVKGAVPGARGSLIEVTG